VPCCPGFRCAPDPDRGTRCVFDCKTTGQGCGDDSQCCAVANHEVSCGDEDGVCHKCGHANQDPDLGAPCNLDSDCCGFDDPNSRVFCGEGHTCVIECTSQGFSCAQTSECCPVENSEVFCSGDVCDACGIPAQDGIPGGACNDFDDCCGFETDPSVMCSDGECVFGVSSP
jgi:hypothetical protein